MKNVRQKFESCCIGNAVGFLIVLCLVSCSSDEKDSKEAVASELTAIRQDYCLATNALTAKTALSKHLVTLEDWHNEGKKRLDYDSAISLVAARLYAIELELGNAKLAEQHYLKWSNHVAQGNLRRKLPWAGCTTQDVLQMVRIADSNLVLQWKRGTTSSFDAPPNSLGMPKE